MRPSVLTSLSLALLLVLSSVLFWGLESYQSSDDQTSSSEKLIQKINEKKRIQFILFHAPEDTLELVYLASYDALSGRMSLVYIPSSLKIMSPSYGGNFSLKELFQRFSPSQTRKELQSSLQLDIPYWIKTDNNDLKKLIDMTGGIQIKFPVSQKSDTATPKSQTRWMDGPQATRYVSQAYKRFKSQGRRFRHKTFFLGLKKRVKKELKLFQNKRTIKKLSKLFKSNFSHSDWEAIAHVLGNLKDDNIKFPSPLNLARKTETGGTLDPKPLKNMLPKPMKKMIRKGEAKDSIDVQVLNGAGISGLAGAIRDKLQPAPRVDVVEVGNADRYNYKETKIIDRNNNPKSAAHVKEILGIGSIQSNPSEKLLVDVSVIIGKDLNHLVQKE